MEKITASLDTLAPELTAHAQGSKRVFLRNGDTATSVTQVAYGEFAPTDYCDMHQPRHHGRVFLLYERHGNLRGW